MSRGQILQPLRVQLQALGCRLNEAELEAWARAFQEKGFLIAAAGEPADLLVVNTCAVTEEAVRKSRKLLRRTHRANPAAKLVVSGCLAALDQDALAREQDVYLVVSNQEKDRLVEIASRELGLSQMQVAGVKPDINPLFARGRQRAFVKVQDGCRYRCTFCIVTVARGEERSRPVKDVVADVSRLTAEGVQEVVLTGVHLGGYGGGTPAGLSELVRAVLAETEIARLRLGSLEPWDLPPDMWELFANERFMPHLHLPLQSGSDSVLRRMARRCNTHEFARLAEEARAQVPDLNITTDIIVGFPGETASDWQETLELVKGLGLGHIHIFAYSPRAGTRAAALPDQLPAEVKRERSRELRALGRESEVRLMKRFVGRRMPVLIEGRQRAAQDGDWFGYTPNYLPVRVDRQAGADLVNRILELSLEGIHPDGQSLVGRSGP